MPQAILVLSMLLFVASALCVAFYKAEANTKYLLDETRRERTDLREKLLDALNTTNSRETYLKRALEDLAFGEIDRARFALEVVYGKTAKR